MIAFDTESVRDDTKVRLYKPVTADRRLKDLGKIAADEAEKRQEQLEDASLDRWALRIAALGYFDTKTGDTRFFLCKTETDEADALVAFWRAIDGQTVVGHNIKAFDMPVIIARSLQLGVAFPFSLLNPYRLKTSHQFVDTYEIVTMGKGFTDSKDAVISRSLPSMCKVFGATIPDDDMDGSLIGAAVREGRWADVQAHLARDLERTVFLAQALRVAEMPPATTDAALSGEPF